MQNCDQKHTAGFTLIEMLIGLAIFAGIAFIIGTFMKTIFDYQLLFTQQLTAQQELETTFAAMLPEVRSMVPSALGGYAIAQVATSSLTFFVDADADGIADQMRYFLSGMTLYKGIIRPTGNPLAYVGANEIVTEVAHDVVVGAPIFSYFDVNYTGTEAPMAYPLTISDIRLIRVDLTVRDPDKTAPLSSSIEIVPRNLRTNL